MLVKLVDQVSVPIRICRRYLKMGDCGTPNRLRKDNDTSFDARLAYTRLAKKHQRVIEITMQYMSEADVDRSIRNRNAIRMSEILERILGGRPVEEGGFPECCLIGERLARGSYFWFCSGVLIHPQVVLTAAHCFDRTRDYVVALNTNNELALDNSEVISTRRIVIHPKYPRVKPLYDIGVVILRRHSSVDPVELATTHELNNSRQTTLVGFGNVDPMSTRGFGIKRVVDVPIKAIRRDPNDDLDSEEEQFDFGSDLEFVAGGEGLDSCEGDSGGPAYIRVDGGFKVVKCRPQVYRG
jgi:secreted trypsin-like serine protease